MSRPWALAFLMAGVSVSPTFRAFADPLTHVTLDVHSPPECPGRSQLELELRRDLEGSRVSLPALFVGLDIAASEAAKWHAQLRIETDEGASERELSAASCAALIEGASVIVATVIDPETAALNHRPHSSASIPSTPSTPSTPSRSDTERPPPQAPRPGRPTRPVSELRGPRGRVAFGAARAEGRSSLPRWSLGLWSRADSGSLPASSLALGGAAGALFGPWRLSTEFGWWHPTRRAIPAAQDPSAQASYGMLAGGVSVYRTVWKRGVFSAGPTLGLQAARRSGEAERLSNPNPQAAYSWDLALAAGAEFDLALAKWLKFQANGDLAVSLLRPEYGFLRQAQRHIVYRVDPLAARIGAGFALLFP